MFYRQKIIDYIEDKHLPDGGYFFAKVRPAGGQDTCLAVKTLKLLAVRPKMEKSIISFWKREKENGNLDDFRGLYFAAETYKELGLSIVPFSGYKRLLTARLTDDQLLQKKKFELVDNGEIGTYDTSTNTLYTDVVEGELKDLHFLTSLLADFDLLSERKKIIASILSLQNEDGGFGSLQGSQLSTTFYALTILHKLSFSLKSLKQALLFINLARAKTNYLEDLYWTVGCLTLLKQPLPPQYEITLFLKDCWRDNGGFSRSRNLGIPTIEYTYYAVSVLVSCERFYHERLLI